MKSCITISLVRSLNGGPWVLWDNIETSLRIAAEKGFDGVELFTSGPSIDSVKPLSHLLQQNNLSLAAVGTGAGKVLHGLTLTDADPSIREKAKDFIKGIINFGAENRAPSILGSMQGSFTDDLPRETALGYLRDALEELGEYSTTLGTFFIYEPLNRYETNLFNHFGQSCDFARNLETQGVRVLADLFT